MNLKQIELNSSLRSCPWYLGRCSRKLTEFKRRWRSGSRKSRRWRKTFWSQEIINPSLAYDQVGRCQTMTTSRWRGSWEWTFSLKRLQGRKLAPTSTSSQTEVAKDLTWTWSRIRRQSSTFPLKIPWLLIESEGYKSKNQRSVALIWNCHQIQYRVSNRAIRQWRWFSPHL